MKTVLTIIFSLILTCSLVYGGNFQDELQKLAEANAKLYMQPGATAFGTNMNSGLFYRAKTHGVLGFDVGVRAMMAFVPDDDLEYDFQLPSAIPITVPGVSEPFEIPTSSLFSNPDLIAPTVFGSDDGHWINADPDAIEQALSDSLGIPIGTLSTSELLALAEQVMIYVPPGIDLTTIPFLMLQGSVGLPMNSEIMLRLVPPTKIAGDIGEISLFGFGIKHSLSQYIPMCPVHIAGQFSYQSLKVGDVIESNHTSFYAIASKSFIVVEPYIGLGFEKSTLSVDYTIDYPANPLIDGTKVSFDLDGDNSFHARFGMNVKFLLLGINAEYALGNYNVATLGLYFSFR